MRYLGDTDREVVNSSLMPVADYVSPRTATAAAGSARAVWRAAAGPRNRAARASASEI